MLSTGVEQVYTSVILTHGQLGQIVPLRVVVVHEHGLQRYAAPKITLQWLIVRPTATYK